MKTPYVKKPDMAEIKKICACVPFIDDGAGVPETQQAFHDLINYIAELEDDAEICQEALDKLASKGTMGPATYLGAAGEHELHTRADYADEQRKRTACWKRADAETTEATPHA